MNIYPYIFKCRRCLINNTMNYLSESNSKTSIVKLSSLIYFIIVASKKLLVLKMPINKRALENDVSKTINLFRLIIINLSSYLPNPFEAYEITKTTF